MSTFAFDTKNMLLKILLYVSTILCVGGHKGHTFPSCFSSEYLLANGSDSLRILALHEMGNLNFYNGNTRLESVC